MAEQKLLYDELRRMRTSGILCDIKLSASDNVEYYLAHSLVVAAHSKFFYRYFTAVDTVLNLENIICVEGLSHEMLGVAVNYIYGIAPINGENIEHLKKAARILEISSVDEYVINLLKEGKHIMERDEIMHINFSYISQGRHLILFSTDHH